jgi:hypothetical protein
MGVMGDEKEIHNINVPRVGVNVKLEVRKKRQFTDIRKYKLFYVY